MPGKNVLHLECACGRRVTVPYRPEWNAMLRGPLLRKFRCSAEGCGRKPVDLRKGCVMAGGPGDPDLVAARPSA